MAYDPSNTLTFGSDGAPHQLWGILNLGCPDTRDWFNENIASIEAAIAAGHLQAHWQFWSKQKVALVKGGIANSYITYAHPDDAWVFVKAVFANQDALNAAEDVPSYLEATYHVQRHPQAELIDAQVAEAVVAAGITSVPTITYDGQAYFDDSLAEMPVID